MVAPRQTRLRFISAREAEEITEFVAELEFRIQIYQVLFNAEEDLWYLWFVPPDDIKIEVENVRLEQL